MGTLSIVASQQGYKIYDHDEEQTLVTGISSYKNALTIYERLTALQDIANRFHGSALESMSSTK
ncbi:MAG: hypothetical protein HQL74_15725 [Magnetococcales bacterium]|nr:hypothetical protein [Magnetococcales bacterium]MBF0416347.1 hypothetical protein [Magnetococcales bacterium]MBF0420617.1 hypothetical protein [Magnetococcales bacterium]